MQNKLLLLTVPILIIGGIFIVNLMGGQFLLNGHEVNGGTPIVTVRSYPSDGAKYDYGNIDVGGYASISGQFYATEKSNVKSMTVKYWRDGQESNKQLVFTETGIERSSFSKKKSIYFSPGTYHVSVSITTSGMPLT